MERRVQGPSCRLPERALGHASGPRLCACASPESSRESERGPPCPPLSRNQSQVGQGKSRRENLTLAFCHTCFRLPLTELAVRGVMDWGRCFNRHPPLPNRKDLHCCPDAYLNDYANSGH